MRLPPVLPISSEETAAKALRLLLGGAGAALVFMYGRDGGKDHAPSEADDDDAVCSPHLVSPLLLVLLLLAVLFNAVEESIIRTWSRWLFWLVSIPPTG